MNPDLLWSLAWGGGVGVLYGVVSYVTYLLAEQRGGSRFVVIFFGGMLIRLLLALALVALVLALTSVRGPAFVGAFLVVFTVGLVLEVVQYVRRGVSENREE